MPKGIYIRPKRTLTEKMISLESRLSEMTHPVTESGCYLFTGSVNRLGYGKIALDKKTRLSAHRAAYEVFVGEIPAGMHVMHKCDVRCCVRPEHLMLGTHVENMADMARKKRARPQGRSSRV